MPIGISRTETIWLTRTTLKGEKYYITSKENRDCYFLYKEENGKATKIAKAATPIILETNILKTKTEKKQTKPQQHS